MKILFTGMASSHCVAGENVGFFNTIAKAFQDRAEIVWETPKVSWEKPYLESFDLIFFGFIPPTALSANKIYGAMHLLGLMFESPKLRLVVDGQQIWQYKNSIEYIKRDVSKLFSDFYSKRAESSLVKDPLNRKNIELASELFGSSKWPITYYPRLPWTSHERAIESLGFGSADSFAGVNLDSLLINPEPQSASGRENFWSAENEKSLWLNKLSRSIRYPIVSVKSAKRLSDMDAIATMRRSVGLIIPPQDRGLGSWWSYRHIQALNSGTPVVTDWVDTSSFHDSWSKLAYQIEDISDLGRIAIAREQLESYKESLKPKNQTIDEFNKHVLDLSSERI
jgi:hypothetical protein